MMPIDICRRWTQEVSQLRTRAANVRRRPAAPSDQDDILEQALHLCESLLRELAGAQLESDALTRRCDAQTAQWEHLFEQMPVACVEADADGVILKANRPAALLLNISSKYLKNRLLMHFAEDRAAFSGLLRTIVLERCALHKSFTVRPRERAPLGVDAIVMPTAPHEVSTWLWFLVPSERRQISPDTDMLAAS